MLAPSRVLFMSRNNNDYEVNSVSPLALQYGDSSVLERHHVFVTYQVKQRASGSGHEMRARRGVVAVVAVSLHMYFTVRPWSTPNLFSCSTLLRFWLVAVGVVNTAYHIRRHYLCSSPPARMR